MKRFINSGITINAIIALLFIVHLTPAAQPLGALAEDEHFSVKEYNLFHDVLHPLEHEALPKKDFKTIRARAAELVERGRAIVKLGVPAGVQERAEFEQGLKNFETALTKFKAEAKRKDDARLAETYTAVHDTFEMLASMLPPK